MNVPVAHEYDPVMDANNVSTSEMINDANDDTDDSVEQVEEISIDGMCGVY